MTTRQPLFLIIDGNNLAHYAFGIGHERKIDSATDRRLAVHLHRWLEESNAGWIQVELCQDGPAGDVPAHPQVQIFEAQPPRTADDEIIDRVISHTHTGQACLVLSNDEFLLEEAVSAGSGVFRVYDFVLSASVDQPRFLPAIDLPEPPQPRAPAPQPGATLADFLTPRPVHHASQKASRRPPGQVKPAAALPAPLRLAESEPGPAAGPSCRLTMGTWPPAAGVKFLLDSFCPHHRAKNRDLVAAFDPASFSPADLAELARMLVESCGSEPDFARRGSLMDRVRLALLLAGEQPLSLQALAEQTGLKGAGLLGRLREKARPWVEILPN